MATQSSMVTPSIGINGMTSAAPMRGQVYQFAGFTDAANGGFLNGLALANQRDDAAVVVAIHFAVEEKHAIHFHGGNNGIYFGFIAAFGEIRNTFDKS